MHFINTSNSKNYTTCVFRNIPIFIFYVFIVYSVQVNTITVLNVLVYTCLICYVYFTGILLVAMIGAIMVCSSYLMFVYNPLALIVKKVIK